MTGRTRIQRHQDSNEQERLSSDKRMRVVGDRTGRKTGRVVIAGAILAGAVIVLAIWRLLPSEPVAVPPTAAPAAQAAELTFPMAEFNDGKARYYSYRDPASGKKIKFFILKSADGVIRSAFDACDVCFPAKKGYRHEGDMLICNNCELRFSSIRINEIRGGCNPAPLDREARGGQLVIRIDNVLEGARYF